MTIVTQSRLNIYCYATDLKIRNCVWVAETSLKWYMYGAYKYVFRYISNQKLYINKTLSY